MMFILYDAPVIEVFDSPDKPPSWIEIYDIIEGTYRFFDDAGQIYQGFAIPRENSLFSFLQSPFRGFSLRPIGNPDYMVVLQMIKDAEGIEPNPYFRSVDEVRRHIIQKANEQTAPKAEK